MALLRWVAVLPVSFVCGIAAAIIALVVSQGLIWMKIITGLIAGAIFVAAGGLVAPSHEMETMMVLAIINGVYSLSQARTLSLAPGERVDWLSLARVVGGILPACDL